MLGFSVRWFAVACAAIPVAAVAACSGTSSTSLPPTTGVLIRAETLTAGHGCGPGPTQIFKYVVLVFGYGGSQSTDPGARDSYQAVVTSNVFDCYTDGAFISLPESNGSSSFRLEVFAYNRAAYEAARGTLDVASEIGRGRSEQDRARLGGYSVELREQTSPTWTTECTATQQQNVQALASCDPLGPGIGGLGGEVGATTITLDTHQFNLADGGVATCANAEPSPGDGGAEGGTDDAGLDAGDAGDDAGGEITDAEAPDATADAASGAAPLLFSKVRVRTRAGARILADTVVSCPTRYALDVVAEPARYDIDVGLLDGEGRLVDPSAQTTCVATSVAGAASSAICP